MNPHRTSLIGIVLALAVGFVGGWLVASRRTTESVTAPPAARAPLRVLVAGPGRPTAPAPSVAPAATTVTTRSNADFIHRMADLRKRGRLSWGIQILTPQGDLDPGMRELLQITNAEARVINASLERAQARLKALEDSVGSARVDPSTGELVVDFPAFPEQGGKVFDDLMGVLQSTLGPERMALMQELSPQMLDLSLGGFGLQTKSISIKRAKVGDKLGYAAVTSTNLTSNVINGRTVSGFSSTSTGQFVDRASLIRSLGSASRFVPPDY